MYRSADSDLPLVLNSKAEKSMNQTQAGRFGQAKREGMFSASEYPGPGK